MLRASEAEIVIIDVIVVAPGFKLGPAYRVSADPRTPFVSLCIRTAHSHDPGE